MTMCLKWCSITNDHVFDRDETTNPAECLIPLISARLYKTM